MSHFTRANAAEMARRSHDAQRQRAIARENEAQELMLLRTKLATNEFANARAREYDELLVRLRIQLRGERDPMKQDRLASAIARLEDVYQVYAEIPKPGRRRAPSEKRQQARAWEPAPASVGVEPQPPATADTTTDGPREGGTTPAISS